MEHLVPMIHTAVNLAGEFESSEYVWRPFYADGKKSYRLRPRNKHFSPIGELPAPTLEEILEIMPETFYRGHEFYGFRFVRGRPFYVLVLEKSNTVLAPITHNWEGKLSSAEQCARLYVQIKPYLTKPSYY